MSVNVDKTHPARRKPAFTCSPTALSSRMFIDGIVRPASSNHIRNDLVTAQLGTKIDKCLHSSQHQGCAFWIALLPISSALLLVRTASPFGEGFYCAKEHQTEPE